MAVGHRDKPDHLLQAAAQADAVMHLAGVNRPDRDEDFGDNVGFARALTDALRAKDNRAPILFASSGKAAEDSAYGRSKRGAEQVLAEHADALVAPLSIWRLPNIFGKWARPWYNSVVATFCVEAHAARPLPVVGGENVLTLAYIDDVLDAFLARIAAPWSGIRHDEVDHVYQATVADLAAMIEGFASSPARLTFPGVRRTLAGDLYATFLSYAPIAQSLHGIALHSDERGTFAELMKDASFGQFSYFTAHPGQTRGVHYHHSKVERMLFVSGSAHLGFRNIATDERFDMTVEGGRGQVVETLPGWQHSITNVGGDMLVVMLWTNEPFDPVRPDTFRLAS